MEMPSPIPSDPSLKRLLIDTEMPEDLLRLSRSTPGEMHAVEDLCIHANADNWDDGMDDLLAAVLLPLAEMPSKHSLRRLKIVIEGYHVFTAHNYILIRNKTIPQSRTISDDGPDKPFRNAANEADHGSYIQRSLKACVVVLLSIRDVKKVVIKGPMEDGLSFDLREALTCPARFRVSGTGRTLKDFAQPDLKTTTIPDQRSDIFEKFTHYDTDLEGLSFENMVRMCTMDHDDDHRCMRRARPEEPDPGSVVIMEEWQHHSACIYNEDTMKWPGGRFPGTLTGPKRRIVLGWIAEGKEDQAHEMRSCDRIVNGKPVAFPGVAQQMKSTSGLQMGSTWMALVRS